MWFKCSLIYFLLFRLISCDKSFTIVLDTTISMEDELDVIKVNLPKAINATNNTDFTNYVLVPFNDPDVGVPTVVLTPRELLSALNAITVSGGHKCPENSLAGIEKALQISKPQSNIFVFTDAYSKDDSKFGSIQNLCRSTRSQVIIFLSGFCSAQSSPTVNEQVYYDIAKACSGAVVHFDPSTLRQAFRYIEEVTKVEWTDVINYDTFTEYTELSFTVDSFTKTMLLVVSGDNPSLEVSTTNYSNVAVENILDTRHTQVVRLTEPPIGNYKATIRCQNKTSVVLYKRYELPLRFGFSTKLPRSMNETSRRPMPGRTNKILIDASQSTMKLESIEIQVTNVQEKKALLFEESSITGLYLMETFIAPDKAFCIWVKGYDTSTNQEVKGSSENFIPQQAATTSETRWSKPQSEILDDEPLIDYGKNATFACKVTGYPTPNILWEDENGVILPSESELLEIPSLYISYVNIENVTVNSTISCKSKNTEGEDSQSLNLYVYRPYTFDIIQSPEDLTIEYGSDGKLNCEVSAYPAAETKWYHNDTAVTTSDDLQVDPDTNTLWIKNMTVNHIGEYKCEITNEANNKTYSAFVAISGIEAPQVELEKTNITLKLGDWSDIECRIIKGKPAPAITWTFSDNGFDFGSLPDGVVADDGKLKIASAQSGHKGIYRCDATNIEGQDSAEVTVLLQYPPLISDETETRTVTVKEEDDVVLPCEVKASPEASVRWEMTQDDVIIAFDDRHRTDPRHTHRFKALWKDSGNYHCIAENSIGTAEKTVTVNVLVAPYIEAPKSKTVVTKTGQNVVLTCNVLFGNPVPSTKWEFIAPDSTTKVLHRSNSSSVLHLNNVSYTNEGSYLCIADNVVGTDSINIYVKIQ